MKHVHLEIVTPTRKLVSVDCTDLLIPGYKSELGVLPEHNDLISTLVTGLVRYNENDETKKVAVKAGFLQVSEDQVLLLADEAKMASEVDPKEIQKQSEEISAKLISPEVGIDEREALFIERDWIQACHSLF